VQEICTVLRGTASQNETYGNFLPKPRPTYNVQKFIEFLKSAKRASTSTEQEEDRTRRGPNKKKRKVVAVKVFTNFLSSSQSFNTVHEWQHWAHNL
jgi:hypothetical protein